ncbi:MAG: DVUA0089 family protein [Planctomycetota bacterium]
MKTALIALAAAAGIASAQPATVADFGTINAAEGSVSFDIAPNEIAWVSFTVGADFGAGSFFELSTVDLVGAGNIDTEIGLYDAAGNLVANDDDGAFATASLLSFGDGSGRDDLDEAGSAATAGQDGAVLAAGTYFLAIGEFNVDFNPTAFDVVSTGADTGGTIVLTYFSSIPSPAGLGLLAAGGLVATRRRRA